MPLACRRCGHIVPKDAFHCPNCQNPLYSPQIMKVQNMKLEKDVEGLIESLKHKDGDVRRSAAFALGEIGDVRAVAPLIQLYEDKQGVGGYAPARWGAVAALGDMGDKRAVKTLISALQDETGTVRRFAAEALGKLGDPRAVKPLIKMYEEELNAPIGLGNKELRDNITTALGKIDDAKARSFVQKLEGSRNTSG